MKNAYIDPRFIITGSGKIRNPNNTLKKSIIKDHIDNNKIDKNHISMIENRLKSIEHTINSLKQDMEHLRYEIKN